ncbi:MAG: SpoIIE family protein phosphatase, partial [Bacteroidia bacterium]|nr:SpoIIE family protein phosphatase [Bacteroidia bacterium]
YERGDEVYLFTDGITDQFGGNRNKKFGIKNLKELITQSFEDSISEKINYIKETINLWKGSYPQTDDMTLIGLKF